MVFIISCLAIHVGWVQEGEYQWIMFIDNSVCGRFKVFLVINSPIHPSGRRWILLWVSMVQNTSTFIKFETYTPKTCKLRKKSSHYLPKYEMPEKHPPETHKVSPKTILYSYQILSYHKSLLDLWNNASM